MKHILFIEHKNLRLLLFSIEIYLLNTKENGRYAPHGNLQSLFTLAPRIPSLVSLQKLITFSSVSLHLMNCA